MLSQLDVQAVKNLTDGLAFIGENGDRGTITGDGDILLVSDGNLDRVGLLIFLCVHAVAGGQLQTSFIEHILHLFGIALHSVGVVVQGDLVDGFCFFHTGKQQDKTQNQHHCQAYAEHDFQRSVMGCGSKMTHQIPPKINRRQT